MSIKERDIAKGIFFEHFGLQDHGSRRSERFDLLREIVTHYAALPYENITKIIKKFTVPDPARRLRGPREVVNGFVERGTGGTCFSLTFCLGNILTSSGFACYPVMADMKRPNIHSALVVEMDGERFLVDPGYLLVEPVRLTRDVERIETPFGLVELRPRERDRYDLFTITGSEIKGPERKWRYRVKTTPVSEALFMRYWQESFSLPMMNSILLTRLTNEGHVYVKNHHLRIRSSEGRRNENIRSRLEERIEREFGIPRSLVAEAHEYIERVRSSWRSRVGAQTQED